MLPLEGADVVLVVQWLQKLGPVTMDYSALSMSFMWHNQKVSLSGQDTFNPTSMS